MSVVEDLKHAADASATIAEGVKAEQLSNPTPCHDWDVKGLLNHVTGSMAYLTARAEGREPGTLEATTIADRDEAVRRWIAGVHSAAAAWATPGALERMAQGPMGEMPGAFMANITLAEIVLHSWDLAKATGQRLAIDERLAQDMLTGARANLPPQARQGSFGPEVAAPAGAGALDQLAAFLGRQP